MSVLDIIASFVVDNSELWTHFSHTYRCTFGENSDEMWYVHVQPYYIVLHRSEERLESKIAATFPSSLDLIRLVQYARKEVSSVIAFEITLESTKTPLRIVINALDTCKDTPPNLTIRISKETINEIINKHLNLQTAFMQGKIQLDGNMALALKLLPLQSILLDRLSKASL
jgi:putative sterol carrier protein